MRDVVFSGRNGEIEETIKDCRPGEQSCTSDNRMPNIFFMAVSLHTHFLQVDIIKTSWNTAQIRRQNNFTGLVSDG